MSDEAATDELGEILLRDLALTSQDPPAHEPTDGELYRAFQEAFRGTFEEIAGRHERYVPYVIEAEAATGGEKDFLDVGCGRGEFVQLLANAGVRAICLELDEDVATVARSLGLDVHLGDGIRFLQSREDAALAGVSANSVIEHMQPADFLTFIRLIARKVAPGGVVILETNNPSCTTAMGTFWLDLTHVRPYHPLCVGFYLEQLGFERLQVLYSGIIAAPLRTAADVTFNYADYTIVGFRRS